MNGNDSVYFHNKYKERLEIVGDITLNLEYWDCACDEKYIHSINETYCQICNTYEEDSPNSRENEVIEYFAR
ncbi:MAG: hypothetical protein L0Y61_06220, partial [Epsilonproteobacteria bacterium]|nr:hypothetical protein [Campylobacterota bacterium]